jgi:hypothetical protein
MEPAVKEYIQKYRMFKNKKIADIFGFANHQGFCEKKRKNKK